MNKINLHVFYKTVDVSLSLYWSSLFRIPLCLLVLTLCTFSPFYEAIKLTRSCSCNRDEKIRNNSGIQWSNKTCYDAVCSLADSANSCWSLNDSCRDLDRSSSASPCLPGISLQSILTFNSLLFSLLWQDGSHGVPCVTSSLSVLALFVVPNDVMASECDATC